MYISTLREVPVGDFVADNSVGDCVVGGIVCESVVDESVGDCIIGTIVGRKSAVCAAVGASVGTIVVRWSWCVVGALRALSWCVGGALQVVDHGVSVHRSEG